MRSPVLFLLGSSLFGLAANAYAQDNDQLEPFVDARVGGVLLGQGRGSVDNDADLLVARERFDENLGRQSLYFRFFDGTNDLERVHFDANFVGATIQDTFSDITISLGDIFVGVGDIGDDYGGFNNSRGIEGTDDIISGGARAFAAIMTAAGGIDDFRVSISFDDLDPSNARVNRGSAFVDLTLYAGGAQSPLAANNQSGTNLGVLVGESGADAAPGDGDFSGGVNVDPEGSGGFQSPALTQSIRLFFLFEDVDIEESNISLVAQAGASTGPASITIDNFFQGVDLDGDNAHETNGSLFAPNLPLQNIVFIAPTLTGPGNATIPASAFQISNFADELQVGEFTALNFSINVPANAASGLYSGAALVFEDNNNNGIHDAATEPGDTVLIEVQIANQDADGDGLSDDEEDINGNGVVDAGETNPNNPDSDNDGIEDGTEVNGQNPTDPLDADSDNDGLLDGFEDANQNGARNGTETDPNDADSDNGGEPDGSEVLGNRDPLNPVDDIAFNPNGDDDSDGLRNGLEDKNGNGVVDDGETDPNNPDSDLDGLDDGVEDTNLNGEREGNETDPTRQDTDGDALPDGTEVLGANPTDPLDPDTDDDGLDDGCEDRNQNGSFNGNELNPNEFDTDDDGLSDSEEDANGSCQLDAGETDGTDPDTDDGGEVDGSEVDGGRDPFNPADDIIGAQSLYIIGGGSCSVDPSRTSSWWVLLLLGLFLPRRKR